MDGYVYSACNIITAGEHAGSWIRVGFHPSPQPAPSPKPPAPTSDTDVVWTTPSENVLGSMPLGNGKLVRFIGTIIWFIGINLSRSLLCDA